MQDCKKEPAQSEFCGYAVPQSFDHGEPHCIRFQGPEGDSTTGHRSWKEGMFIHPSHLNINPQPTSTPQPIPYFLCQSTAYKPSSLYYFIS